MEGRNDELMVNLAMLASACSSRKEWTDEGREEFARLMRAAQGVVVTQDLLNYRGYVNVHHGLVAHKDKFA